MATKANRNSDAIALLEADHARVKQLGKAFEKAKESDDADDTMQLIAQRICQELTVHAQVEEEVFYPAVREAIDDDDLMDEADVEHASAKALIAEIESMSPGDDHYDAKVKVLCEYVDHHVDEEENEMFPKARKAKVDLESLGEAMAARKAQLQARMAMPPFDEVKETLGVKSRRKVPAAVAAVRKPPSARVVATRKAGAAKRPSATRQASKSRG